MYELVTNLMNIKFLLSFRSFMQVPLHAIQTVLNSRFHFHILSRPPIEAFWQRHKPTLKKRNRERLAQI